LEQQLFGHPVKALPTAPGDSDDEDADGGTLVLEDAEFLSLSLQRRLGRYLKRNHSRALLAGLRRARIIITTSRSGNDWSAADGSDPDLWGALGQVIVRTPPLREHPDDIPVLADRFLTEWAFREGRPAKQLTFEALELLKQHSWPGNVRELRRVLNQACRLDADGCLSAAALALWLSGTPADIAHREAGLSLREMERRLIETTFARCGGNREHTARTLQIGIRTLSGKLREYGYPPRGGPDSNRKAA
jgi:DNA-binding NtrC family response regulator